MLFGSFHAIVQKIIFWRYTSSFRGRQARNQFLSLEGDATSLMKSWHEMIRDRFIEVHKLELSISSRSFQNEFDRRLDQLVFAEPPDGFL